MYIGDGFTLQQLGVVQTPIHKNYFYDVIKPATNYPITLVEVREHLRIDPDNALDNPYLEALIIAATKFAENYINIIFIKQQFVTYRDNLTYPIELRRGPMPFDQPLLSFDYKFNGVWNPVPATAYYVQYLKPYVKIVPPNTPYFGITTDPVFQSVRIKFLAGMADTPDEIPQDLKLALKNHISAMYENRGDADQASAAYDNNLPVATKIIYDQYKVLETY